MRRAIGIDVGGTTIKMALINEKGGIEARATEATSRYAHPSQWLDELPAHVTELLRPLDIALKDITGVGVGVPGFTDFETGHVYDLPNIPGWGQTQLGTELAKRFPGVIRVDNDVNVMAFGECMFGAGRPCRQAVFVTLGTGVGGALLINGRLYRGAHSMAGEIGHLSIKMDGVPSPLGAGGLEEYVGNQRIAERARQALEQGRVSLIRDLATKPGGEITPHIIALAAERGDALALEIFDFVADCLATAFAGVAYVLQPEVFIVGGGVAQAGAILFDPLRRRLRERLSPVFYERVQVIPATLGNDAGVIGGGSLALFTPA